MHFDQGKLIVRSPKTEAHAGGAWREVPLFPRLREILQAWRTAAPAAAVYVIARRDGGVNWRTRLTRLIARAGILPWPKLFHNMRASRESELAARYPLPTVCRWLGHRPEVAAAHYLMQTNKDGAFQDATTRIEPK